MGLPTVNPDLLPPSPPRSPIPNNRSRLGSLSHVVAFAICILLAIVFTLPGSLSPDSALLGYPGDNFQHAWFLWHFARAIIHAQNPFCTTLIFYPSRVNLAWSTTDPLAGTLALPVSLISGPVMAYNISIILQLALSAFFARLLCLKISQNEVAALFGGAIFGFSPFFLAHALGHLSLITAFPIPLFLLALDRIFTQQRPSWKPGAMLGVAILLAAFAHYDYAVLCLLVAFFWVVIELNINRGRERIVIVRRVWKPLGIATTVFVLFFSPVLEMLVGSRSEVPVSRGMGHIEQYSADMLGFLVPSWNHILLGHFAKHADHRLFAAGFEGTVYVGPIALVLACIGFWNPWPENNRWAKRAILLSLAFYFLSLGPRIRLLGRALDVPGPAALFYDLPFARFFSAPARFQAIVALFVAILCSLGVRFLLEKYPIRRQQYFVVLVLSVLLLADYLTVPFPRSSITNPGAPAEAGESSRRVLQACTVPADVRKGTVLTFPLLSAPYCLKSMWMQIADGGHYALIDGYLSYTPESTWKTFWNVQILRSLLSLQGVLHAPVNIASDRRSALVAVRDLNLSAVVVFDSPERDSGVDYLENVFGVQGHRAGSCTIIPLNSSGR